MDGTAALNPWFLVGLAAVAIPLIIHLIERRRVRRVVFGSLLMLRGLVRRVARRRRTSELLLLLLRMLIVALLALGFSRPLFRPDKPPEGDDDKTGKRRSTAILVDCSASMGIGSRMAEARKQALAVVDDMRPGDHVAVYTFAAKLEPVAMWTAEPKVARQAIEALNVREEGGDLATALHKLCRTVTETAKPKSRRQIVVCSDMQTVSWEHFRGEWRLPPGMTLRFAEVGGLSRPPNVGIVKIGVPSTTVLGSGTQVLNAQLRNYSQDQREAVVHLYIQGKKQSSQKVVLTPESTRVVSFRHEFTACVDTDGEFTVEVEDDFELDNRAGFVVPVKPKIQVLLVNGSLDFTPRNNDGYYLSRALAPSQESVFEVQELGPDACDDVDFNDAALVVLADVPTLSEAAARNLKLYLHAGGAVLFFTGTQTRPDPFNHRFKDIAPCRLDELVNVSEQITEGDFTVIAEVDFQHPVFQPFAKPNHGDFGRVNFSHYFAVSGTQAARVLARFENGKPAVVLRQMGKGQSLLVASGADLEMNNFALRAVFLPFVHQAGRVMAAYAWNRPTVGMVGQTLVADIPGQVEKATLVTPTGEKEDLDLNAAKAGAGAPRTPVQFELKERGIHRLNWQGDDGKHEWLFAANLDPREGNLVRLKTEEISMAVAARPEKETMAGKKGKATDAMTRRQEELADEEIEEQQQLGRKLLVALALLLFVEMAISHRASVED